MPTDNDYMQNKQIEKLEEKVDKLENSFNELLIEITVLKQRMLIASGIFALAGGSVVTFLMDKILK